MKIKDKHNKFIQRISLETILIVCGNEIRSAISYFKQCLGVLIYLSIHQSMG